jgi:PAS domain S-box-containing protein
MRLKVHTGLDQSEEMKLEIKNLRQELRDRKKIEKRLLESEEKFEAAFRSNPNALALSYRENGIILDVNDSFLALLELKREDVIGKTPFSFRMYSDPADREEIISILRNKGSIRNHEMKLNRGSGEKMYALLSAELLNIGGKAAILTTIQDITSRKKIEEELQKSEERYRELVESANSMVIRWNNDGKLTFVNEYTLDIFGYTRDEMIGKNVMMIVPHMELTGRNLDGLSDDIVAEPSKFIRYENENIAKNGKRIWVSWTNRAIRDETGKVKEVLAIGNDITEHKKTENKLKVEHNILEAVISNIGTGFVVADTKANILSQNDAALRMHDFRSPEEELSEFDQYKTTFELEYPDGRKVPLDNWPLALALRGEYFRDYRVRLINPKSRSRKIRYISYNTVPIYDSNGEKKFIIITMTDLTDIHERTAELEESELRYHSLFNNTTLGIVHCRIITDEAENPADFSIIEINDAFTRITGLKKTDVEGKTAGEVLPEIKNDPYNYIGIFGRAAFNSEDSNFENYFSTFGKWLSVYVYSPRAREFTAFFTDITERKRIEEEALARATEIEAILSCIADGVIVYDKQGRVVRSNAAAQDLLKFKNNEWGLILDEKMQKRFKVWTEDGHELGIGETPAYRATMHGEKISNELYLIQVAGEKYWINLSAAPLLISGRHSGGVVSLSDVTRRKHMEDNLAQERELFEGIFDNIPVMITIYDPGLKNFRFNMELRRVLGWTEEDVSDGNLMSKIYPDPVERKEVTEFMQSLKMGWREFKSTAKDGSRVDTSWANIYLNSGIQIGIGIDITRSKKAEEALRKNEQRLQGIFNDVAIGILEVDSEGRIITTNVRACEILGYNQQELLGKTITEITAPEDRPNSIKMNEKLHRGEVNIFDYEKRYLRKDGKPLWVHITVSAVRDSLGQHINSIGTIEDISERRMATESLEESEERFRSLFENITEGVALHELILKNGKPADYRIIDVNPAYRTHTGIEPEEARGSLATELFNSKQPPHLDKYAEVAITGKPYRFETFYAPANKHFVVSAISPKKGQFATVFEDITDQKKNEMEIRMKNEELTRFIYTVSHDLKSPLVTIKSFTNYLREDIENNNEGAREKDLKYIQNAADKMGYLLDELLELSRIGRKEEPKKTIPLKTVVRSALDLTAGRITEKKIKIMITDTNVILYGHSQRFIQLYQNLIDNAAKFMADQTEPLIEIGVYTSKEKNGEVVLFVRDNGSGIDPRHRHKIFGLFEKMDNKTEGTGIGLALVKRIVEVHGGTIWFNSPGIGKGTTFYFTLEGTQIIKNSKNDRK